MDQDKNESDSSTLPNFRQSGQQPVARQPFVAPVNRSFAPVQRPQPTTSVYSQPPVSQPAPIQPVPSPFISPQSVAATAPVRLSFEPPAPAPKAARERKLIENVRKLSGKKSAALIVAMLVVLAGGGLGIQALTTPNKSGITPHGRQIVVGAPTLSDHMLETSCYTIALPTNYTLTHTNGCVNDINLPKSTTESIISIASNPGATAFPLKDAPLAIKEQLKVIGIVRKFDATNTKVNGLDALKVMYQLGAGPEQVLVYIPNPPAKYINGTEPTGSFMVRGYYNSDQEKTTFDSTLNSLRWVR